MSFKFLSGGLSSIEKEVCRSSIGFDNRPNVGKGYPPYPCCNCSEFQFSSEVIIFTVCGSTERTKSRERVTELSARSNDHCLFCEVRFRGRLRKPSTELYGAERDGLVPGCFTSVRIVSFKIHTYH